MRITDIDQEYGYYDPLEDELSRASMKDTRKKHLTLRELNKIKKIGLPGHTMIIVSTQLGKFSLLIYPDYYS